MPPLTGLKASCRRASLLAWIAVGLFLLAAGTVSAGPTGSTADIYEFPPYNDSTQSGTANLLAVGVPQDHTIHVETDEDWGIVYDSSSGIYQLELSDFVVPSGSVLKIFAYTSGLGSEPAAFSSSEAVNGRVTVGLQNTGDFVYYQVRLCDDSSPFDSCVAPDPLATACSYRVELKFVGAGRVGAAIQIDGQRMSIPIGLDDLTISDYRGARAFRSSALGGPEVLVGGTDGLSISFAQAACDCPPDNPGVGNYTTCLEIIDTLSSPPGFDLLSYRLELVRNNDVAESWETMDATGTFIGGLNPAIPTFCVTASNVAPNIAITIPSSDQTVSNATTSFAFSGTASDSDGTVASIQWRVNGGAFQAASGTTTWNFSASLIEGENVIEVQAVDNLGASSNLSSRTITRAQQFAEDIYEFAPFNDSCSPIVSNCPSPSSNLLAINYPQQHTLHVETDEDWGLIWDAPTGSNDMELQLRDVVVPAGHFLRLLVYRNGVESPSADVALQTGEETAVVLSNAESTLSFIYYSVQLCKSSDTGTCVAPDPLTSASGYTIELRYIGIPLVGAAIQLDQTRMSVPVSLEGLSDLSEFKGAVITRVSALNGSSAVLPGPNGVTVDFTALTCDCPSNRPGIGGKVECIEVVDTLATPPIFDQMIYQFELVRENGAREPWTEMDSTGSFIGGFPGQGAGAFCGGPVNLRPTVVVTSPATDPIVVPISTTEVEFSGTASDPDGSISAVYFRIDGGSWLTATGTTSWSFIAPIADQTTLVEVRAEDGQRASSTILSRTVTRGAANVAPTVTITSPSSDQSVTNATTTFAFSGTASDSDGTVASIQWRVNGGAFQVASGTTSWSFSAPLVVGANLVDVQAVDNLGAVSSIATRSIARAGSNAAPSIVITSPASDQSVPNATTTFAFSGTASDSDGSVASIRWRVNGGAFQNATGTTAWSFSAPLSVG
ncbi:hypothetical protein GC173_06140, partial [bacterium]|nr:hypothetical protein [bacterium]